MRKRIPVLILGALAAALLTGCSGSSEYEEPEEQVYEAPGNLYYVLDENNEAEIVSPKINYAYGNYERPLASGDVVIPEEINGAKVTSIRNDAFYHNINITSVTIPGTVKTIGDSAFSDCYVLSRINIDYGVEEIGNSAFYRAAITQISIPDSVRTVGGSAFSNCSGLTYVDYNGVCDVASVFNNTQWLELYGKLHGSDEFYIINDTLIKYNGSSENVVVPYGVRAIGNNAFSCGYSETSNVAYVELPDTVEYIYDRAFENCEKLVSVFIPESVSEIEDYAFSDCSSLISVDLPDSITVIGDEAFSGCTALTTVDLPDSITVIGSSAFSGCTALSAVDLPNSITTINTNTFEDCTSLSEIVIPYGVAVIEMGAFAGCTSLTEIDLPESLTEIYDYAFQNCENLNDIVFPECLEYVGEAAFSGTKLLDRKTDGDFLIIDDVLCAYTGNSDVIYIPDGVRLVTGDCFTEYYDNYNGIMPFTEGASLIFPESVEVISNIDYMDQYSEVSFKGDVKVVFSSYYGSSQYQYISLGDYDTRMSDIYLTEPIPIGDYGSVTIHYNGKMYSPSDYKAAYAQGLL